MGLQLTGRFLVPESKRCSRSDQKCEIWPRLATPQPQHHLTQVPRDVIWFYQGGRGSTWARIRIANQLVKVTLGFHFHPKVALAPLTPHCQVPARKVRAWVETSAGLFAYTLLKLLFFIQIRWVIAGSAIWPAVKLGDWVRLACNDGALLVMITKYTFFFFIFGLVFPWFFCCFVWVFFFFGLVSGKFHFTNCKKQLHWHVWIISAVWWYQMPAGL